MVRLDTKNGEMLIGSENVLVTTNQWYHVAVSVDLDTGRVQVYLNGVLVLERNIGRNAEFDLVGTDYEPWDKVFGFRDYGNAATLVGCADNLQVFNRAATPSEMASVIAPRLSIGISGGVDLVSASAYLTDYRLEFADGLGAIPVWQPVDVIPLRVSDQFVWPVAPSVSALRHGMFRLVKR